MTHTVVKEGKNKSITTSQTNTKDNCAFGSSVVFARHELTRCQAY